MLPMPTPTHQVISLLHLLFLLVINIPVLMAIQGHPESGRIWEEHINSILFSPELGFQPTTRSRCFYRSTFDDFAISCK